MSEEKQICPLMSFRNVSVETVDCVYGLCMFYQESRYKCSLWVIANQIAKAVEE